MEKKLLLIGAILEGVRSLKDRSYKLTFETSEPSEDQALAIHNNLLCAGYLAFKDEPFRDEELKQLEDLKSDFELKNKTPGQRLRAVLYRLWEQHPEGFKSFPLYYEFKMDQITEHFKGKLDA